MCSRLRRDFHTAVCIIYRRKALFLYIFLHSRSPLEGKRVYGQAVRGKLLDLLQCFPDVFFRLFGKAEDNVHVDVVKARLPAEGKCIPHLLHRVTAADQTQGLLLHGLGIDTDPGDIVSPDDAELVHGDAVRSSRLNGKFLNIFHGKIFFQHGKKPFQLCRVQCCRCASADIDSVQHPAAHELRGGFHLFFQGIQIVVDAVLPHCQIEGGEGTVEAGGGTEGNAHIEAVALLIVDPRQDLPLSLGNLCREQGFFRADQVFTFHFSRGLLDRLSSQKGLHGDFGRPDPDEFSPGKGASLSLHQHPVEQMLHLRFQQRALDGKGYALRRRSGSRIAPVAKGDRHFFIRKNHPQKRLFRNLLILPVSCDIRHGDDLDVFLRIKSL